MDKTPVKGATKTENKKPVKGGEVRRVGAQVSSYLGYVRRGSPYQPCRLV